MKVWANDLKINILLDLLKILHISHFKVLNNESDIDI